MDSTPALTAICALSSITLRVASYIFLRWIPGHLFVSVIFSAFAVYAATFTIIYLVKPAYKIVGKTTEITVVQPKAQEAIYAVSKTPGVVVVESESTQTNLLLNPNKLSAVEATQTVVYRRKDTHPLKTLLLGTPSPSSRKLSWTTFAINSLLTLATWDLTFRTDYFYKAQDLSFARIGYVGPNSAKLLFREPDKLKYPVSVWYQVEAPGIIDAHLVDTIPFLTEATDYTKTVTIPHLNPETKYRYFTSAAHNGTFTTAPPLGKSPAGGKFTFLTSSCIKPRFPYDPLQHPLAVQGFKVLGGMLEELKASFMLFLGDFIYIDVPRRPGVDVESYRQYYRQIYASPDWPAAGNNLPWIHVLDDHEIANDWSSNTTGIYPAAIEPFNHYQHAPNPPAVRTADDETYYSFSWGSSASFFMLDTRRYRSHDSIPDGPGKTMLGKQQLEDLLNWLKKDDGGADLGHGEEVQWKFIVSSVPFTKNWRFGGNDTWAGYLHERRQILETAWSVGGRSGVVVLSGDRHEFAATAFPPPENSQWPASSAVHEFSCSPLSQFYLPIRTYRQEDNEDVTIKYQPDGNVKFGAITIDTTNVEQAVLKYQLFVDGVEDWSWVLTAPARGKKAKGGLKKKQWS
ncbi:uncharacterized protein LAJ45_05847 [Morchella importuna]|uniref:PhoD-like phosphatase metallophosphatase domain-containing protein n=1 Tax=Morchella conica CCBAS932 TaxID=1392247 RepID=A0A3N4KRI6_9PEZI|nr:uncharacterized protein LAJ45_05847 [Morchella importuna]KAH8150161.1 hypothetical protein LAJ45_05847 [Morchella importuna]RPB11912.1 hypothetical protein P167DRAFT_536308 [Morchella conica CCBAS932]